MYPNVKDAILKAGGYLPSHLVQHGHLKKTERRVRASNAPAERFTASFPSMGRQTWRNPNVGEDAKLLGSSRQQHSVIRRLEDERHPNVYAALLDLRRGRSHLSS